MPGAGIWVHAGTIDDMDAVVAATKAGGWVEYDSVNFENIDDRVAKIERLMQEGILHRVLLSHDEASYELGRTKTQVVHTTVFSHLFPALKERGFTDAELSQMVTDNPRAAFTVEKCTI